MTHQRTQYHVVRKGQIVCIGTQQQCWIYLFNTEDKNTTAIELANEETFIEPHITE